MPSTSAPPTMRKMCDSVLDSRRMPTTGAGPVCCAGLLGERQGEDPLREPVAEIRKAGERAAKLTGQLLTFSRKQIVTPQLLDLNAVIGENLSMLQRVR